MKRLKFLLNYLLTILTLFMLKFNYSTIFLLFLFMSFHGFSENPADLNRWSIPVSSELPPISIANVPTDKLIVKYAELAYDNSFKGGNSESRSIAPQNDVLNLVALRVYAPCDIAVGTPCDDGNPNTGNDVIDSDCECRGIALTCQETQITYEINGGPREIEAAEVTISEGDSIELFANLENFTLTDPNGTTVNGNTINNITTAQAGIYSVKSTFKQAAPTAAPILHYVDSEETVDENAPATNALDGNPDTYWHTEWVTGGASTDKGYPHEIQLDMGANSVLSGFTYLPRQNGQVEHGRVAGYEIYVSNSTSDWGTRVASGTWGNNINLETVNFPAKQGRYLRFVAVSPVTAGQRWASAAEITVKRGATTIQSVSSEETTSENGRGTNALDGVNSTIWHTRYTPTPVATLPHHITLDLGFDSNVTGLTYLPRQSGTNGRIINYEIFVSNSTTNFGSPIHTGTWTYSGTAAQQNALKTVSFPEARGRYVRLVATSAVGNFGSASEVRAVRSSINAPCIKTIRINVDPVETFTYVNGSWTPTTPMGNSTANDIIRIDSGNAVLSNPLRANSVVVSPGAALTINSGITLTANTTTLKSSSTSYSSLIVDGNVIGIVNYERYVNKSATATTSGNDLISSPLANVIFNNAFVTANPNIPENTNNLGEFAFAPFNITANAYENYDIGGDYSGSFPLVSGTGYKSATKLGSLLTFTGSAPKTNIDISISDAYSGRAWNLIGNPYPSYIDVGAFFTTNNMNQLPNNYVAIYGYLGSGDNWEIYNNATSEKLIAPGQGFFVKAQPGGGTIQFTPAMRSIGDTDDFILGRQEHTNKALSKLKLSNASNHVVTSIYFIDGTTRGLDRGYDAAAYAATAVGFSMFTHLLEDHTGLDIGIQSLPYSDFNDVVVPLGIKAKAGAELSISIDELSTLPVQINVYLEDKQNNTLTLLNKGAFKFKTTTAINGSGRFNIHYSARTLSVDNLQSSDNLRIYTTTAPKLLFIMGQLKNETKANLYDVQGRLVLSKVLNPNSTENTMDVSTLSTGIYVVKINNDIQVKTQKVLIK